MTSARRLVEVLREETGQLNVPHAGGAPVVSIGLPVHNGANYLGEALDSLLAQTYTDFEIVASDNGSTDETADILARYAARDRRIRVHKVETNRGAGWNFNRVLELAQGRYFKWHAHDDVLRPDFLERCVAALDADPRAVLAHTGVDMVDERLAVLEHYGIRLATDAADPAIRFRESVLPWQLCFEIFGLIRKSALDLTSGMPNFSHGDGVLLAELALLGPFRFVDHPLFLSRQHDAQSMRQFGIEGVGMDYHAYAVWFNPDYEGSLQFPNWHILGEYQRLVWQRRSIGLRNVARCERVILRRARKDARHLRSDLRVAARFVRARALRAVHPRRPRS